MARRPVDQEDVEAASRLGPAREIEARCGDDARALRGGDAFGRAAEVSRRAHAHFGEYQHAAALFGDEVDLAEATAPVALDQPKAGRSHQIGAQVLGSRPFAV